MAIDGGLIKLEIIIPFFYVWALRCRFEFLASSFDEQYHTGVMSVHGSKK